jgi:hypothetical protein
MMHCTTHSEKSFVWVQCGVKYMYMYINKAFAAWVEKSHKGLHPLERFTPCFNRKDLCLFYAARTANNDFLFTNFA